MSNRHLSRTIVLQSLFEWDFINRPDSAISSILEYNMKEFSTGMCDLDFSQKLINTVVGKKNVLDDIIQKAAPQWPIEKISVVDRNILRIGLAELLFSDKKEIPPKVAINESIELAKNFGGENSGRFVSGVLGTVYKEMGEPGKDEISKKKKKIEDIPYDQMLVEKKCGAVVYATKDNEISVALVHDIFGHWTLSKGSGMEGEDAEKCTARVVKKEMGIDIKVEEKLGDNEYIAYDPEKGKTRRQVVYYLASAEYAPLVLEDGEDAGGLDQAKWFKLSEILDLNFYDDILPIVTKAIGILKAKK
ncbi:transcription antitermination factor NusB [Candidatus Campbellbacteria bacterium RIFCSPLOWO2_02_FULL_35_11]|uniref:Transcription antitermination protein NusB n=2 Tax=Candidatus Campbelliibacteriota TaxID=1752727 RepID=A0A1F5EPC4_9BACT|nr:MAG: transcription antitermination factor NusB [Candidatus Campbellbacteria bacterium RIFCSPHIGHO2_12_FULL_35_10]OGD69822.1 MAG: transcription antitermination factor NusB [Candidatus Campbellbacteria bacterium RIFCSPLOWO2_02_FULL_35_11]